MSETIVIIGGGISGLSAAYTLQQETRSRIVLLEADRLGGKIQTTTEGDLLIEHGPDSVFTAKPAAMELIRELDLESEIIEPQQSEFAVFVGGRLHPVPRAMVSLMSIGSGALERVGFLSAASKRRVLREREVAPGHSADESIASFFRRRFGSRFSKSLPEPMLAGIHAGDPQKLSMAALYPAYLGLEQRAGSLSAPTAPAEPGKYGGKRPGFISLRSGIQTLSDRLVERLERTEVRLGTQVHGLRRSGGRFQVLTNEGLLEADGLILAVPPYVAAELLRELSPEAAAVIRQVRHVSTAVATFAFPAQAFPDGLRGNGFLVATGEPCAIGGCTWTSNKWAGRAPDGRVLMRAFLGRDGGGPDVENTSDHELLALAERELNRILHPVLSPTFRHLHVWKNAMPQAEVGHLELMDRVQALVQELPLRLAGAGYRGSGIPDCIRQGREAARAIARELDKVIA